MATIFGGNGTGTLDSSLYWLNRNDTTGAGSAGYGQNIYIDVSNGDLVLGRLDGFLPSETKDFISLRTYNSRGQFANFAGNGWVLSSMVQMTQVTGNNITIQNADGSQFNFTFDAANNRYVSVDGAGAYETITYNSSTKTYALVQSDQTVLTFNNAGLLLQSRDTNGNTITYSYQGSTLTSIADNSGHKLTYTYSGGYISQITDETGALLAAYTYSGSKLMTMTDRAGEVTHYAYNNNGLLQSITLPANTGDPSRTIQFTYAPDPTNSKAYVLASFTDAQGNVTRFSYNFNLNNTNKYNGGTTTVTDALGRVTTYSYDAQGEITNVTDATGLQTSYTWDANKNLISTTDANGYGITHSDSAYYRNLRQSFGIVEAGGLGKLVSELTASDIATLVAKYTTTYTYDGSGNLLSRTDGVGNTTSFTYTVFNKVATSTSADGNAIISSDDPLYVAKRQELGYVTSTGAGKLVAQLTASDKQALLALYTTRYSYDAHQNLTQIQSAGGDLTAFTYDAFGNLTKRTVYLDKTNLTDPTKQEVTQYFYDVFGNNVKTIDAQGATTLATFDHFGNRTTQTDGNGGVTTLTYDAENRLLTTRDALGNMTVNTYDAVGNRTSVTDASGHAVTYLYSLDNLLVGVTDPSADRNLAATRDRKTSYIYDVMGNRTASTDAEGRTTAYTYDALNRLVLATTPSVSDPSGNAITYTSTFGYDGVGNRISVVDNNGNKTSTIFNPDNLTQRVTDATGHSTDYLYDADLNQVSIVVGSELAPAARQILKFDYDQKDRLISDTDALGNSRRFAYDGANNRLSLTDANGNTTNYSYDRDNRLLIETLPAVSDPTSGNPVRYTVQYQYDANGNQVARTDQNGHTVTTAFDKDNRAILVTDANGIKTVYSYDSRGNRTSVQIGVQAHLPSTGAVVIDNTDGAQVTTYSYDEFNQVVATTDGVGNALISSDNALYLAMRKQLGIVDSTGAGKHVAQLTAADIAMLTAQFTEHYTYDRVGNYTSTTDQLGRKTTFTYDGLNRQVKTINAASGVTSSAYDGDGNRVSATDALGHTTRYTYDAVNRLTDTIDALGVDTHRTYDAFGNVLTSTAASGSADARKSTFVYDLDNRLITSTDPQGNTQSYTYDAVGNRLRVTDAKGQNTNYVYDALNRNIAVIDPLGLQTKLTYDGVGNRLSLTDARGGVTRFTYDAGNREIQMQDAQGRVTTFTFDVRGNRITQTTGAGSPEAETSSYLYDAQNHLRQVTDAAGNITSQDFDAVYNRTRTTDANGHATTYAYDALNRQISVTDAVGGTTTYAYDAVGNRLSVTDANGHVTAYAYDARNQLIQATDALGVTTTYGYDSVGNQVRITHAANTSAAATRTFTYSLDDRLLSQIDALGHTQTNQYDADNNVVAVTDALGHVTHYAYDADNRVTSVTDALGNVTQYLYDANGNRTQVVDARGFTSTRYYDADNEVVLSVDNGGYANSYSYDHNGNITAETLFATALALPVNPAVLPTPTTSANDRTTHFTYDALNRLASRTDGEGYVTQYVYDAVGNRIQTKQALDKAATQFEITRSYYDVVNREVARLTAQGYLTTYQYDALGNRTGQIAYNQIVAPPAGGTPVPVVGDTGRATTFGYDADNRLVSQTDALGAITQYTYDARGNRISMSEAVGTPAARTTSYQYDAADRYVATTNALGFTTTLTLDADGNVLKRQEAAGTSQERDYTFSYDANNRVVSATDALGVVTQTHYDAAGNVTSRILAAGTPTAETSTYAYDGDSRQISATDAGGTITTYGYDAAGNEVSLTQATGLTETRTNTFQYDRANRLVSATDALGTVTQYQYDGAGNKVQTIQAAGTSQQRKTTYAYDLDNRLTTVTDPMGAASSYQYDAMGNQTRIINANGAVQVNTFDALGHSLTSLSAASVLTRNAYDLRGNLVSTTQSFADGSDARTSTYAYDVLNRQTQVTDGEGFSTSITYDAFGNQIGITHGQYLVASSDPSYSPAKAAAAFPQSNTFVYDADNHLLSLTDAVGNVTRYTYDAIGNRLSTIDGNGHTTLYSYDLLNRLVQTVTPEGGITKYTYDHLGNRIAQDQLQSGSSATGVWAHTSYQYDANGHLTSKTDPLGIVTQYTYDTMGNQLAQTLAAGTSDARTTRMEYDLDNRKTADVDALGNRTTYAYDAVGNRIKVTDPLGHIAHYYYDGANQLSEVVDPFGVVNTFSYDAAGNRTQTRVYMAPVTGAISDLTPPAPTAGAQDRITTQQYDRANRLIAQTAPDGSLTQYAYDGAGNKLTETQFANTAAPRVLHFAYDADNRLTTFTDVDGAVTTFTYDAANNKLSQTVSSASDPNPNRTTTYTYDANNRELSETFDPSGLDIVQSFTYDHLGNVVSKTDGDSHTATFAYDLDNRQISQTDALGNTATTAYDRVGNKVASTDANGNTTNYVYDLNNRLTQEIKPSVQIVTLAGGSAAGRPTTTHVYDAAGNEVQIVDASGNVTTRYFDGDRRLSAQINADNALTTYTYDAAGDKTSQTLYMTRLPASAQNPAAAPAPPAGASQPITYAYDLMGRVTLATYPAASITTLSNVNTSTPTATTATTQVTERNVYDAYGNVIESIDRNGNQTVYYYDAKNQRIASVDALGYLTQWSYDSQGNLLEQRQYAQTLNVSTLSPGTPPAAPAGDVAVIDFQYDAASRKVKETDPQISTFDPTTQTSTVLRPTTTYTYDKIGNQLTKTLGAGTSQAVTEYSYYDADNRRIAVVNSARVLSTYGYDANGNLLAQKRYFTPVDSSVNLGQLSGSTNFSTLVASSASQDEETDSTYDALNRQTSQSDLLSSGALTKQYGYDALSNRTYTKDEDGYITQASYDAMGRLAESVSPDGSGTIYQYDAAGNQVLAYTGIVTGGPPSAATGVAATLGSQLSLSWHTSGTATTPIQTWIVYDTASHTSLSAYPSRTTTQVSSNGQAQAALSAAASSTTLYFRVVTEDGAGNETWTAEQSLTIPPRFTALSVAQPSSGTIVVTAQFDPGVANPQLVYGAGALNQSAAFVQQSNGSYQATLTGVTNPAALSFAIHWQDGAGNNYSSAAGTFAAAEDQVGVTTSVSQTAIVSGTSTAYTLSVGTQVPTSYAAGLTSVQAQWRLAGSGNAFAETAVAGTDSGQGLKTYSAVLGDTNNLTAGTYEIVITGVRADGSSVELDHFTYTTGASATSLTRNTVSWNTPAVGNDQLVVIDGQHASSLRDNGRTVATDPSASAGAGYSVFYGQDFSTAHTVNVSSAVNATSGYDVTVQATLSAAEAANIGSGGLHLAWRPAGTGTSFANDVALVSSGTNTYSTTLSALPAGQYDVEVYYVDSSGNTVIVEWQRFDAATVNTAYNGTSLTVLAQETGGSINTSAQGVISVAPGLYTGSLDVSALTSSLSLALASTGNAGGSLQTDGRSTGYFVQTQYDALGYKIASNSGDGLWRQFKVDGNGNTVETDLLGTQSNTSAITTYTAYDARNRKTADFGAPVSAGGSATLATPVTRYTYNFLDKVTAQTDALGNTTQTAYNLLGTAISQTDPYGNSTQTLIDQFGNVTAQITQLGHRSLKFYDLQGNLTAEQDALGNTTNYTYDSFGRRLTQTDALGNTTHYAYDQRDRLVQQTDPMGNAATFKYDGRNDRISTLYPQGERTDQVYDSLGRVIDTQVYLNGQPTHSRVAYDAYGNIISETDPMGRTKSHLYGAFGRLLQDIDEDGNVVAYNYDVYGRVINTYDPNTVSDPTASSDPSGGKDIQKTYDAGGRITSIVDLSTGVSTTYTYDLKGQRLTEVITTPGNAHNRNISYQYDALGQMVRWADAVTGDHLNRQFDDEGNLMRVYTDSGYDPLGQNTGANPNYRYIDHVYTYDADRRILQEIQRTTNADGSTSDAVINGYTYDAASNRSTWNNAGTVVSYTYDADGRSLEGDYSSGADAIRQTWVYDAMGNVLAYTTYKNGSQSSSTVSTYNDANRVLSSNKDGQVTTDTYDASLRVTQTVLQNKGKTYTYDYTYYGDGRQKSIKAFGDASGNSTTTYDANKVTSSVNLGQGDGQSRPETKTFVADNEGHLIFENHDDGKSAQIATTDFLYANGQAVGQSGIANDGTKSVVLDSASYAPIQNLSDTNPGNNLTYTLRAGDSLQSIAYQMYGNASLWFVIAEANGLSASDALKPGTQILIPNTIQNGTITADNHKVYSESEIVGSTLPNLKSPPPPHHGGCGSILAIIIVVVIAVVVAVVAPELGGFLADFVTTSLSLTGTAATVATVAAYAVAGAVVAAIGSVVQQGLFIALGYQSKFSWKQVAGAAVSGLLSGAASGAGAVAQAAAKAGTLSSEAASYTKVAEAALKAASVGSEQLIDNGKITSWTSLAAAAVGGYASATQSIGEGELAFATTEANAATTAESLSVATANATNATSTIALAAQISSISNYVTPWAQLAETSIRNGKLTPEDWAGAVGATLAQAVVDNYGAQGAQADQLGGRLENTALRLGSEALVAGALSTYDKSAAETYVENSVGQEAGQFIGQSLATPIQRYFGSLRQQIVLSNVANQTTATASANSTANAPPPLNSSTTTVDASDGVTKDQNGNPTAPADSPQSVQADQQTTQDAPQVPAAPQTYTVQKGDSYARIAREVYDDERYAALIMAANGVDPTYGNVHGLQVGTDLTLPDISALSGSANDSVLRVGGRLIATDQSRTDSLAAQLSARATSSDQGPDPETEPVDPRTGLRAGPTAENAVALGLTPPVTPIGQTVQATGTIGPYEGFWSDVKGVTSALFGGQIGPGEAASELYDSARFNLSYNNEKYGLTTRALGAVQIVGGVGEAALGGTLLAGGAATSEVGVGIPVAVGGYGLLVLASDQASTGLQKLLTGQDQQTLLSQGIQTTLGVTRQQADLADATVNGIASISAAGAIQSSRFVAPYAAGSGALSDVATAEQIAARQAVAKDFYSAAGYSEEQAASHMAGIDFTQPVEVVTLKQGEQVVQYQVPGRATGSYFAPIGTPAEAIGVDPAGRVAAIYTVTEDTSVLRSTAANTSANTSLPSWARGSGGGTQYFAPSNPALQPVK